jgi:hypothetical protein
MIGNRWSPKVTVAKTGRLGQDLVCRRLPDASETHWGSNGGATRIGELGEERSPPTPCRWKP